MWRRPLVLAAVTAFVLSQPAPAFAKTCEDICGERAAEKCENIDSMKCAAYIAGCLAGCYFGKLVN
ncbi:MAG: hypothetical protein JSU87_12710 [Gemmatimonadota bacterium]|nr:MAG: hypothetical protein JSU87_12710 [Gemmatimonadota bacterium]